MPRIDAREPDQLRPLTIQIGYLELRRRLALITSARPGALRRQRRGPPAALPARHHRRLGHGRVRDAAALDPHASASASPSHGRIGGRTHEIQRLIGRSLRAVATSTSSASAPSRSTATCSGRRRHAHRLDHRRLRRPGARMQPRREEVYESLPTRRRSPPPVSASSTAAPARPD